MAKYGFVVPGCPNDRLNADELLPLLMEAQLPVSFISQLSRCGRCGLCGYVPTSSSTAYALHVVLQAKDSI